MQIFFGACLFFIAVILLAYVPGRLVLLLLKRTLSPLEDVTLACVLGLLVSGLASLRHREQANGRCPSESPIRPLRSV
jgi:hypothetical protein